LNCTNKIIIIFIYRFLLIRLQFEINRYVLSAKAQNDLFNEAFDHSTIIINTHLNFNQ